MNNIEQMVKASAATVFTETPVLFAYLYGSYATSRSHPYSDLDIGVYIPTEDIRKGLNLELSLALAFDEALNHRLQTEVRILNRLPLAVIGRILGEAKLIYSCDEGQRVAFESGMRRAYFDFLPVIQRYRHEYRKKIIAESQHGIA